MGFLVGVGAAAAIGGAVIGTVFPQVSASISIFDAENILNGFIILLGTLATLIYFQFGLRRESQRDQRITELLKGIGWIGQSFIAITFGALFAGVYIAALTALIERFSFLWNFLKSLILPFFGT